MEWVDGGRQVRRISAACTERVASRSPPGSVAFCCHASFLASLPSASAPARSGLPIARPAAVRALFPFPHDRVLLARPTQVARDG